MHGRSCSKFTNQDAQATPFQVYLETFFLTKYLFPKGRCLDILIDWKVFWDIYWRRSKFSTNLNKMITQFAATYAYCLRLKSKPHPKKTI